MVRQAGSEDDFLIASAATHPDELGSPVYPMARQELAKHGIGCPGHQARLLTPDDYTDFDLLIGMDQDNIDDMHDLFHGDPDDKIHLIMDYTGQHRDVADPWYTRNFTSTWRDLSSACSAILQHFSSNG